MGSLRSVHVFDTGSQTIGFGVDYMRLLAAN